MNFPERDLFIWCILTQRSELALIIWKHSNNVIALALLASMIYSHASGILERQSYEGDVINQLKNNAKFWEHVAVQYLNKSFSRRKNITITQLVAKIPSLGGSSCLTLGFAGVKQEFMSQSPVHVCLDWIWFGHTKRNQSMIRPLLAIIVPFLLPCLHVIERNQPYSIFSSQIFHPTFSQEDMQSSEGTEFRSRASTRVGSFFGTPGSIAKPIKVVEKKLQSRCQLVQDIYNFYNSPRITFFTHSIFLIVTITILSYNLIFLNAMHQQIFWSFETQYLFWYMMGLLCDEIRQIFGKEDKKLTIRFKIWFNDAWNMVDLTMLTSFFIGLALLTLSNSTAYTQRYLGKLCFSLCLLGLYIRVLQSYLVSKNFGPKIYMMEQMVKDTIVFFGIMALIFFSYGVVFLSLKDEQVNTNNNTTTIQNFDEFVFAVFNNLILEPYWQIHGNMLDSAFLPQNSYTGVLRVVWSGLYVLFTSILMVNLLVAMFSFTFQNIQDHSYRIWSYFRFEVVNEFSDRPFLPSPLILLNHVVRFCFWLCGKTVNFNAFKKPLSEEEEMYSKEAETFLLKEMQHLDFNSKNDEINLEQIIKRQTQLEKSIDDLIKQLRISKMSDPIPETHVPT